MSVMQLDVDSFPTAAEHLRDAALRNQPLLIAPPQAQALVLGACVLARARGVRKGMELERARKLCREARVLPPDHNYYQKLQARLVQLASSVSPVVEPLAYGRLALDMKGMHRLHPDLRGAAAAMRRALQEQTGLQATFGIAANKLVSAIAAKEMQLQGEWLYSVRLGEEAPFLAPLPSQALPDWENRIMRRWLQELNLSTIGQIQALRPDVFCFALGPIAQQLYRHAHGIDPRPVLPTHAAAELAAETCFQPAEIDDQLLLAELRRMLEGLCFQLRSRGLASDRSLLELHYSDDIQRSHTYLYNRTQLDEPIFQTLQGHFSRMCDRRVRVRRLILCLRGLVPHQQQGELFPEQAPRARLQAVLHGMDHIRQRFGPASIHQGLTRAHGGN
jgi:DNA polymerase-4